MRGSRAAALLLTVALLGCTGAHGSVLQAEPPDRALFTTDDLPAGFTPVAASQPRAESWCGGSPVPLTNSDAVAQGAWVNALAPGQRASIEQVVVHFRPGAIDRFLASARLDQSRCSNGVDLTTVDGVHLRGMSEPVDLPLLGAGGMAIEGVGGVDVPDGLDKTGGWVTRIIVPRGDSVSIVVFAVAGLDYDTGMRDRLAHLAAAKLEGSA